MQTRKKIVARNADREHARPNFCRHPKKISMAGEKKVTELITSSARKKKSGTLSNNPGNAAAEKILSYLQVRDGIQNVCTAIEVSCNHRTLQRVDEKDDQNVSDTIFSPAFQTAKDVCCGISENESGGTLGSKDRIDHLGNRNGESKVGSFDCHAILEEQQMDFSSGIAEPSTCRPDLHRSSEDSDMCRTSTGAIVNPSYDMEHKMENLSSEVTAIYFAMQNSKLECIAEPCPDSMPTEDYVEADEVDDYDDFDPYLFIRNLPDLSAVVPTFRPVLLPRQTRSCPSTTLVLDLDETLVHSSLEPFEDADFTFPVNFNLKEHTVYVRCRPHLKDFVEKVSSLFEIIIFTASQSIYAERLLNVLDPKRRLFRHRIFRDSCVYVDGNYLKDLSVLGRDLSHVIIIDNSPQAFGFQVDNGIPIESWFDDRSDQALPSLLPFLESLVGVEDVRPLIAKKFNLRNKIATAGCPSLFFGK